MESIEHNASVTADLNAPQEVTLYDIEGDAIRVPAAKASKYLAMGFRRDLFDIDATYADICALFEPAQEALLDYVNDVKMAGYINTHHEASRAAFLTAWEILSRQVAKFIRDLNTLYEERHEEAAS